MPVQDSIASIRGRFRDSCAFSCVAHLLMGFGDRHAENILCTERGELFHIDFSYLLGDEPATKATLASFAPTLKLTVEMQEAMGGQSSQTYAEFKEVSAGLYDKARKEAKSFYYCLWALVASKCFSVEHLRNHVVHAFLPGETSAQAKISILNEIAHATQYPAMHTLMDYVHSLARS